MNKYYIYFYALIIAAAVISSVYKKFKKASSGGNNQQKKPVSSQQQPRQTYQQPKTTQPKTLEDILKSLMDETKPPVVKNPEVQKHLVSSDKEPVKSITSEDFTTLEKMEKTYYAQDTELGYNSEMEDYDELTDHHVHGVGFDNIKEELEVEETDEWADIDWRKAVISAEILKRPEY